MIWAGFTILSAAFSIGVLLLQIRGTIDERGASLAMIGVVATLTIGFLGVVDRKLDKILKLLSDSAGKK
ncbi:MAG: hypothetical protein HYT87_14045 [Nitrospirae bacterium]|nr:hypothetical protein [Nitrospirota bacterium]